MPEVTSMFTASDGRPFEVRWGSESDSRELWHWNNSHYPVRLTPLHAWVMGHASGRDRAYAEAGIDAPHLFRRFEIPHGFHYTRQSPYQGDELVSFAQKSRALAGRFGGACNVFEAFCLPKLLANEKAMQEADVSTPMDQLADLFDYGFHMTHVGGPAVFGPLQARLTAVLATKFPPPEAALLTQEVGQGSDSATLQSDRAIARLGEAARANGSLAAAVAGALHSALAAIESAPGGEEFRGLLAAYLREYGARTERWGMDSPTLAERPELVIEMIRQSLGAPRDEAALRRNALALREAALARIETAFAGETDALATIGAIAQELERYVFVREGRALRQLVAAGSLRMAVLRKGDALLAAGAIADRMDVLFLDAAEIDSFFEHGTADGLKGRVAARRREHDSWAGVNPPAMISANDRALSHAPAAHDADVVLRGEPGSRGLTTGIARVVLELDEGDALEPGEILVCVMTSPPWTPLFGVASAIVTDSGYALSHSAIAGREYGIPCVVGTHEATRRIRTGDTITVDGDAGTVTVLKRAG